MSLDKANAPLGRFASNKQGANVDFCRNFVKIQVNRKQAKHKQHVYSKNNAPCSKMIISIILGLVAR